MLLSMSRCLLSLNVFFVMVELVSSLKCFECTLSDIGCDNPVHNDISTVDCRRSLFTLNPEHLRYRKEGTENDEDFQCLTTIEKNSTSRIYTRRCALKSERILCDLNSRHNYGLEFEKCSLCQKDYCNTSNVHKLNLNYLYLLLVLIYVVRINYM